MMVSVVSPARNDEQACSRDDEMVLLPNRRDVPEASPDASAAAAAVAAEDIAFEFELCSFFGEGERRALLFLVQKRATGILRATETKSKGRGCFGLC